MGKTERGQKGGDGESWRGKERVRNGME